MIDDALHNCGLFGVRQFDGTDPVGDIRSAVIATDILLLCGNHVAEVEHAARPGLVAARNAGIESEATMILASNLAMALLRAGRVAEADAVVGLTANTPAHLDAVRALAPGTVDYLGAGVIHPTSTKPDHPAPLGVDGFRAFASAAPVPTVAIGGIGLSDLRGLRAAGASGAAVVSAICTAADPRRSAEELVAAWEG